jgi:hypothetical protein
MIRRLIGLMLLITLLFPPVAAVSAFFVFRDTFTQIGAVVNTRIERVQNELEDIEAAVQNVQEQIEPLIAPVNSFISSVGGLIDDLNDLNIGSLRIPGITLPDFELNLGFGRFTIVIPDIPSVNLTIPGLSALRGLVEDVLQGVETLGEAVGAVINLGTIPDMLADAVTEVQLLASDFGGILAAQSGAALALALACALWFVIGYIVVLYLGWTTGWRMLMGR